MIYLISSHHISSHLISVVYYQKKNLLLGYIIIGLISPALIGHMFFHSAWLGIMWFGVISRCISWHCIFRWEHVVCCLLCHIMSHRVITTWHITSHVVMSCHVISPLSSINSFSHWIGDKNYQTQSSAVWVPFIEIFQNGEGHHNYRKMLLLLVVLCCVMLCCVVCCAPLWRDVMWYDLVWCDVMWCDVT